MELAAGNRHLLDYWHVLRRRRWIVYLSVIAVTLAALIGSFLVTPLYRSTVTLQIERQSPDILTFRDLGRIDHSWAAYSDFYQTQYRILSSKPVARDAVERLGLTGHPEFESTAGKPGLIARAIALIPRRRSSIATVDPLDAAAMRVRGALTVAPIRNSQLVEVSWVSTDQQLAADVANAVADAYVRFIIRSQHSASGQAEEFLVDQIGELRREIAEIESQLQVYGESRRIVSVDEASNITLQALQDIAARRTAAQTALAAADAGYRSVREAPADALPEVLQSSLIARLREEYAAYEAEFSVKSRRFKDGWPEMQTLQAKLERSLERLELETERIADQVRASREAEYRKSLSEVHNFDGLLAEQEHSAQRLKRDAVEFLNYQSEVEKKRETLDRLVRRQGEMSLTTRLMDAETSPTNIRIMQRATPPLAPYRPDTRANLFLGLLFGVSLGLVLAFFLDYLDNTINSTQELERVSSLPLLAVIPRHGEALTRMRRGTVPTVEPVRSFDQVSHQDGRASASEAYRELRTAILMSHPGEPPRRIVVTSALPEEGKTATAINLATVLAQLGRRVLLVDTDLRRPRLHRAFERPNREGVSTYLSGLEDDTTRLIVPTPVEHLDLLPSGPIPPNPSELLNSARFAELGGRLIEQGYDHVLFDSPPSLSVSDARIIAAHVDTGILVVRAGRTPRQSVKVAAARFAGDAGARFGVVLNDLDRLAQRGGYEAYRYDEPYGAGADADTEPESRRSGQAGA